MAETSQIFHVEEYQIIYVYILSSKRWSIIPYSLSR